MRLIHPLRQKTIIKLAIAALFAKVLLFNIIFDGRSESFAYRYAGGDDDDYRRRGGGGVVDNIDFTANWTPKLGEQLGLTRKEYRVKRRQYNWRLRKEGGGLTTFYLHHDDGGQRHDDNNYVDYYLPISMGYYNLSCPFEWYKYSCAHMQENEFDERVTAASLQYYQNHFPEIKRVFDSVFNDNSQQKMGTEQQLPQKYSKRIFMTGDSLLRQLFISLACNAFSLYDDAVIERAEVQWRNEWPCFGLSNCIQGGQHSGFDAASILFTNGLEMHYVPHRGFAYNDASKGEPEVLTRMAEQIDRLGKIGFGTKTAFSASGPMDVLVYNVGAHFTLSESQKHLGYFVREITTPLMKKDKLGQRRPKLIYVTTPTQHFNTHDGQYKRKRMDDESSKCVAQVPYNPRARIEKRVLKPGVNVDILLDYDDLELGNLHVHKGDCTHYCMPGAPDLIAARLLFEISS